MVTIKAPRWKERTVGIAEYRFGQKGVELEIEYRDRNGKRLYPHIYFVSRQKLLTCPVQIVGGGVRIRLVKIDDLEVIKYRGEEEPQSSLSAVCHG